jgi:hypothetical protein
VGDTVVGEALVGLAVVGDVVGAALVGDAEGEAVGGAVITTVSFMPSSFPLALLSHQVVLPCSAMLTM